MSQGSTDIAFEEGRELVLNGLRFPQQALLHGQRIHTAFPSPHPVDLRVTIRTRSLGEVVSVMPYVSSLCLGCCPRVSMSSSER